MQLSYVYSDSMAPTLETNDGFLVTASDSIETGDIVTFWAPDRETYVTHRIVGRSVDGFITQGDNNPTTDQAAGYAPVTRSNILGEVLTFQGDPVTIPGYGALVRAPQGNSSLLLVGLGILLCGWLGRSLARSDRPQRTVPRTRDVIVPLLAVSVLSAIVLILVGATVHQFTFVAIAGATDAPNTLTVGESTNTTVIINRSASPFSRTVVTADNMEIAEQQRNATTISLAARIPPPEATGRYVTSVSIRSYPAVLPLGVLRTLNRLHPVVAATVTTLIVMAPLSLGSLLGFDGKTPIPRSRTRWLHRLKETLP